MAHFESSTALFYNGRSFRENYFEVYEALHQVISLFSNEQQRSQAMQSLSSILQYLIQGPREQSFDEYRESLEGALSHFASLAQDPSMLQQLDHYLPRIFAGTTRAKQVLARTADTTPGERYDGSSSDWETDRESLHTLPQRILDGVIFQERQQEAL